MSAQAFLERNQMIKDLDAKYERQEIPHERRLAYYINANQKNNINIKSNKYFDVLISDDKYLDILPKGINKGSTLELLLKYKNLDKYRTITAGDTLNDYSMLKKYLAIIPKNAEISLVTKLPESKKTYHSFEDGTHGIYEGLEYYNVIKPIGANSTKPRSRSTQASDMVIAYHRMPVDYSIKATKNHIQPNKSPNGIVPTLIELSMNKKAKWICLSEHNYTSVQTKKLNKDIRNYLNSTHLSLTPIFIKKNVYEIFYQKFSKDAFWPILHSFPERAKFNHDDWRIYLDVNKKYVEEISYQLKNNGTVWIHDYNLWMVPYYLRKKRPDAKIAFFHHTPFPSSDIFNMIPWRKEILTSLAQCNQVGFHIPKYASNFHACMQSNFETKVKRLKFSQPKYKSFGCAVGIDKYPETIETEFNNINIAVNPVSVNVNKLKEICHRANVIQESKKIANASSEKIILSAERVDYTKGTVEKLEAYKYFLSQNLDYHSKVTLILIVVPSNKNMSIYNDITSKVNRLVGEINGAYGTYSWTPIKYINRRVPYEKLISYYMASDICLVTPLSDGLNLVAKEFIIANYLSPLSNSGILVISEFAGAAVQLNGSILVNPFDILDMNQKLLHALSYETKLSRVTLKRLYQSILKNNSDLWLSNFMKSMSPKV